MSQIIRNIFWPIDYFLNRITTYRLVLYVLVCFTVVAEALVVVGIIPFGKFDLVVSSIFILFICWAVNTFFSYMFDAPTNVESVYITAFILVLIIQPIHGIFDLGSYFLAAWASIWAMASKYILTINKKHIFNPAALGVAMVALFFPYSASWWIGSVVMVPFVTIGGIIITRKIKRFDLVISFFAAVLIMIFAGVIFNGNDLLNTAKTTLLELPIYFFAFVMLTEPLTMPPRRMLRIVYGVFVGILYAPYLSVAGIFSTPELALLVGNIFSISVMSKHKLILTLKRKELVARDTYDFVFESENKISFKPGQYMEWTLVHDKSDSRGVRRYFTVASSPTENELRIGVKFYPESSSFKNSLMSMEQGDQIAASQLAGDFTLSNDKNKKLVFIAGGIGITPFRSMIKYLLDKDEKRDIWLLYSNKEESDIAYKDIFTLAREKLGLNVYYTLTEKDKVSADWSGGVGFLDGQTIKKMVPDYKDRLFFISGPQAMVLALEKTLYNMGVSRTKIITDYFPGFA